MNPDPATPSVTEPLTQCPKSPNGHHQYREVDSTWDWEKYECRHCGDTYKIYEEDMK